MFRMTEHVCVCEWLFRVCVRELFDGGGNCVTVIVVCVRMTTHTDKRSDRKWKTSIKSNIESIVGAKPKRRVWKWHLRERSRGMKKSENHPLRSSNESFREETSESICFVSCGCVYFFAFCFQAWKRFWYRFARASAQINVIRYHCSDKKTNHVDKLIPSASEKRNAIV